MGAFHATVQVGNPDGGDRFEVEALVDTGASDSMFPASMLTGLHLQPKRQVTYTLADGSEATYGRGAALVCIAGREEVCPVIFGPEGDDNCLIGATTMQILMLVADPTNERLEPAARGRLGYGGAL